MAICEKCGNDIFWPMLCTVTAKLQWITAEQRFEISDEGGLGKCAKCYHTQMFLGRK